MPLLAGSPVIPTPGWAPPVPLGLTYIDPDGQVWEWSDLAQPVNVTAVAGLGSPPSAATITDLPGGARLAQAYEADTRTIIVGLIASHENQNEFLTLLDRLHRALWTVRAGIPATGILRVHRPDGTARQVKVLAIDGMDGADQASGLTWASYAVSFVAEDPFWEDPEPKSWSFGSPAGSAGVPSMPPVVLLPSTVLGATTVVNSGDADSYPVWTIHGPGTAVLTNTTTGRSFGLDTALGPTEVVTVDTRPTRQSAVDGLGANRWSDLVKSSPRDLWPLVPGMNELNLAISGSGPASEVTLEYTRRWLRA